MHQQVTGRSALGNRGRVLRGAVVAVAATLGYAVLGFTALTILSTGMRDGGIQVEAATSGGAGPAVGAGEYFPAGPVEQGWPANALLVYSGYYANDTGALPPTSNEGDAKSTGAAGPLQRTDGGDWLAADFRPFVSHLDANGQPDDTFFDTFVFLAIGSDRGRQFGGEYGQDKASLWPDWQWYIQRLFAADRQLAGLEQEAEGAATALQRPEDWKLNVYIMIPYPSYKVTDFQRPGAASRSLLPASNRVAAVQAYVDEVLARWQAWQPRRLRLAGFYWMQEHVNPDVPGEEQMVPAIAELVHQKGYKLGWIPWSGAYLATSWRKYGFDWAVTQPNHLFQNEPGLIAAAARRARSASMGVEIELDGRVHQPEGARRFYDYLDGGVQYGYMGKLLAYYQDVRMLAQLYQEGGLSRKMYDDVYAFAKGTYPRPTAAAVHVHGRLVDPEGQPVANARVQLGEGVTLSQADGSFAVMGGYRSQGVLLVSGPQPGSAAVGIWPVDSTKPDLGDLVLRPQSSRLLAGFDTAEQVSAAMGIGVDLQCTTEPATQGAGALAMQPNRTWDGPRAVFLNLSDFAGVPADWSGYQMLAVDVWTPPATGAAAGQLWIALRDDNDGLYARSYPLIPSPTGGWQTLVLPLEEAATGKEHVDMVGSGQPGGVDLQHIARITINWQAPAQGDSSSAAPVERLVFDQLRLGE